MEQIPTVFLREVARGNGFLAVDEVNPDAQWVLDGEGVPTIKLDGSACLVRGVLFARRHKHNADKGLPPTQWIHHSLDASQKSGHGWLPVDTKQPSPADRYHVEAWTRFLEGSGGPSGTYELVGPKVQGNPYKLDGHQLWKHGSNPFPNDPFSSWPITRRDFDSIRRWLEVIPHEGIVWHHPDGRMAKIKRRDFGIQWP